MAEAACCDSTVLGLAFRRVTAEHEWDQMLQPAKPLHQPVKLAPALTTESSAWQPRSAIPAGTSIALDMLNQSDFVRLQTADAFLRPSVLRCTPGQIEHGAERSGWRRTGPDGSYGTARLEERHVDDPACQLTRSASCVLAPYVTVQ